MDKPQSKSCRGCLQVLNLDAFPSHPQMGDGHLNFCRTCTSAKQKICYEKNKVKRLEQMRQYREKDPELSRLRNRDNYHKHKAKRLSANKEYRKRNANKLAIMHHDYYEHNKADFLAKAKQYRMTDGGRDVMARAHAKERVLHAQKIRARYTLSNAIRDGRMARGSSCQCCGNTNDIEAHHYKGYEPENALDVMWLCMPCHKQIERGQSIAA